MLSLILISSIQSYFKVSEKTEIIKLLIAIKMQSNVLIQKILTRLNYQVHVSHFHRNSDLIK